MGKGRKTNAKMGRGGKIALWVCAVVLLLIALIVGVGALNANIVRVRRAEVAIADLPPSFDGVRILYASDIDLCGVNTPEKSGALFDQLQSLKPDILILGGDYNASSLFEVLNRPAGTAGDMSDALKKRAGFFHYIQSFDAPLGRYAIATPDDRDWDGLKRLMEESGVVPLINERRALQIGGDTLWLAGVCSEGSGLNAAGSAFKARDCVVTIAYSPSVMPILLTSEASDGGQWSDMTLCGHTHGGQIRLFGKNALDLDQRERRLISGWNTESGQPILTTTGVGCEGVNLRLGSSPEVWLITLIRG